MTRSQTMILIGLGAVIGLGAAGAMSVKAADWNRQSMRESVIERFDLKDDEVCDFMAENRDELRDERRAERTAWLNKDLASALEENKITEKQKEAILAKHQEIRGQRGEAKESGNGIRSWVKEQGFEGVLDDNENPKRNGPRGSSR